MKIAIIHDWLDRKYGAEEVLEHILNMFPDADIFTLVDFLPQREREFVKNRKIKTSFIQQLPFAKKHFRKYLALFPIAIEGFDLSKYDLIISSSHAVAKGVITYPYQTHICYVNSQIRYAWDMQEAYLKQAKLGIIKSIIARRILHKIRIWEVSASHRVDHFICNSSFSRKRLKKTLGRDAEVIYPPIDTNYFKNEYDKSDYYFTASRLVGYKAVKLIIETFNLMPEKKLYIAGSGDEEQELKKIANKNIVFLGKLDKKSLKQYYAQARAFIYAAIEDFGIVMVESLASGTPVIAYKTGGASEIITKDTGILYDKQNSEDITNAINDFEKQKFSRVKCIKRAEKFSIKNFKNAFSVQLKSVNE